MYKKSTPQFGVISKREKARNDFVHLYMRITFGNSIHEKSLGIKCQFKDWYNDRLTIKNNAAGTREVRQAAEEMKQKIMGAYYLLAQEETDFSLEEIMDVANGQRKPGALSFNQAFTDLIVRMEKSIGLNGYSKASLQKHKVCKKHFDTFLKKYYRSGDIHFSKINRITIEELAKYFRTEGGCAHNTSMKYLMIIKKVYRIGMDNGWVKTNAFANYKIRLKVVDREFLTERELQTIRDKHFEIERLAVVKDIFIFSCFTGLAYSDVKNLKRKNIMLNQDTWWIKSRRTKTNVEASIPLLGPAKNIVDKYHLNWENESKEMLIFGIISNQKMNAYLKEIAAVCGIDKNITFHLARHTFATTVTLSNDIPLETVSKMLGHSRISMTQHYSKVVDLKIARDTKTLISKFK